MNDVVAGAAASIGNVLMPQQCVLCGATSGATILCRACSDGLPRLSGPLCRVCALPSPAGTTCGACLAEPPHFDASFAVFRYDFPIDRLVQALKYDHRLALAAWFAQTLIEVRPPAADLLLAMPLSRSRLAERGFNQALEIARPLAHMLDLPLAPKAGVRRRHDTPQAGLPWQERRKNVLGAFDCRVDLTGKSVIVIDDVMTTGASVNALARSLKERGARKVTNWVVARALRN